MNKNKLERMIKMGFSISKISQREKKAYTTVRYWLKKHNLETKYISSRKGKRRIWTVGEMTEAIRSSETISDVLRKTGLKVTPGNYKTVNDFIIENKIDVKHMIGCKTSKGKGKGGGPNRKELSKILVKNSTYSRNNLKKRLLKEGLLRNICSECGLDGVWKEKPLKMVLDHINGVNNDNRLKNLRMLCPNCNSQQDTFCSGQGKFLKSLYPDEVKKYKEKRKKKCACGAPIDKNAKQCLECYALSLRKVKERPSKQELKKMIDSMTWRAIGKKYEVSDNAIKKWARTYKLI